MTVTYLAGGKINGLSSDSKPTLVPSGSVFVETDTGNMYLFNGTVWREVDYTRRPSSGKEGQLFCKFASTPTGLFTSGTATLAVGTGSQAGIIDTAGVARTFDTGGTINSLSGHYTNTNMTERSLNPRLKTKFKISSTTAVRLYLGFTSQTTAQASSADPLNTLSGVGLWLDTAVSANWKRAHNDGTSTGNYDDTSVASDTSVHTLEIFADDANSKFTWQLDSGTITDMSTDIPATGTDMGVEFYIENTAAASKVFTHYYAYLVTK